VIAKRHNAVPHPDAARWLAGIDDVLYSRVAALGLCQPRAGAAVVTVANLLDRFDAAVAVKPTTQYKYRAVADSLRAFLGADAALVSITPAHADNWRKSIAEPKANPGDRTEPAKALARATVAKRVVIAKGVFRKAVRWGLIASNPFADLRAGSQSNPDRAHYVTVETIRAILAVCPDDQWRAIIALSRFAGLRCPSEVVGLRWGDIVWDKGRMTVRSPKTANHEGHAVRVVPIAPELRPILQDLFDHAEPGTEAVVPRLRDAGINLRTQFERIIGKAGVKPWPRLFHNMRASCATDWVERFPAHVVAGWLGHSPMIAAQHYLQTRDAHFDLAAGVAGTGEAAANPATHTRPSGSKAQHGQATTPENPEDLVGCGVGCNPLESGKVPPEGLEPSTR
jgi:integrase